MNPLQALTEIIAKKRKADEQLQRESKSRYMTEGEKERIRIEKIERERAKAEQKKVQEIGEELLKLNKWQNSVLDEIAQKKKETNVKPTLSDCEVMLRLRQRKKPIMLFGEEPIERYLRLKELEEKEPMEYAKGAGSETLDLIKNLEGVDKEADVLQKEKKEEEEKKFFKDLKQLPQNPRIDKVLKIWGKLLDKRSDDEKKSFDGRKEYVHYLQCKENIEPFFIMLRDNTVDPEILSSVLKIISALRCGAYQRAESYYLEVSIGNAAWPMGVTMVGIHERAARERIQTNQIAHIFNDDKTRKFLQSIKRLITRTKQLEELGALEGTGLVVKKQK